MNNDDQNGFTVVELLVVIVLLGVVGGVVVSGLVSAMNSTRASQLRIEASAELQRGAERMSRELRAACPVREFAEDGNQVIVAVVRDGETRYHEFYRDVSLLRHVVKEEVDTPAAGGTVLVRELADYGEDVLLRFLGANGQPVDFGTPRNVRVIEVLLRRELPELGDTVEVRTTVSLRNGGRACG